MRDPYQVDIKELFDENGTMILPLSEYFDEDDESIFCAVIADNYENFPSGSNIVKLYYAEDFSGCTHGNYNAEIFYRRT